MPNDCMNELVINGSKKDLEKVRMSLMGCDPTWKDDDSEGPKNGKPIEPLCFNSIVPIPDKVLESGFNGKGYSWCCEHWGTKWGAYDVEVDHEPTELRYYFDSAWGPPIPVIYAIIKKFPKVKVFFSYGETGMDFSGCVEGSKGKVTVEEDGIFGDYFGDRSEWFEEDQEDEKS